MIRNAHMIAVKYLPATNTKPARVKLSSSRFGDSVTISSDNAFNSSLDCAVDYLQTRGCTVLCTGEVDKRRDVIAIADFKSVKAIKAGYCSNSKIEAAPHMVTCSLIEILFNRRMKIARLGGNTLGSIYREEWEFIGEALANAGVMK